MRDSEAFYTRKIYVYMCMSISFMFGYFRVQLNLIDKGCIDVEVSAQKKTKQHSTSVYSKFKKLFQFSEKFTGGLVQGQSNYLNGL